MKELIYSHKKQKFVFTTESKDTELTFGEAVHLQKYADSTAKKIFERMLMKFYPFNSSLPDYLDTHQREGVKWVLTRSRSYLAHAPGAGKTCEAITASILCEGSGQVLFIVPPTATINWEREIMLWAWKCSLIPTISVVPTTESREDMNWKADYIICPDSMLTKVWVLRNLIKLEKRFVAVDEASRFKESESQRSIALFGGELKDGTYSPGLIQNARHAVLLDGSPMPNRAMELWGPVYAMAPESIEFLSQTEFGFRYCGARINDFGRWEFKHTTNESELKARLRKNFMHVVTEEELNHPERLRSIVFMNQDVRSASHKAWEKKNLDGQDLKNVSEDWSQGDLATLRKELGERKVPWVSDYVAERMQNKNESILLFAWHRDVVLGLEKALEKFNPRVVMGGTKAQDREKAFASFQSGETKLLILNIASGGRIHNLQKADRVIFAEYSWTDENNKQCEKRASRRGRDQKMKVRCEYIVNPNSLDERVLKSVFRKAESIKKVIG